MHGMAVEHVKINKINFDGQNERTQIDPEKFQELKNSMTNHGLINPVRLRPHENGFLIVAGARRTLAAHELGWSTIPAVISNADEKEDNIIRAHENLQREDLSIEDEARMLYTYIEETGVSHSEAARVLSRSVEWVKSRVNYYDMDVDLREMISRGDLSLSVASELWKIENKDTARRLVDMAARNGCSVATARAWRQQYKTDMSQTPEEVGQIVSDLPPGRHDPVLFECRFCRKGVPLDSMDVIRICPDCSRGLTEKL